MDNRSSCEIIYEHCFEKLNLAIKATRVDLKTPLVGFLGERSWSVDEIPLEITIGDAPLSRIETLNFINVRFDSSHNMLLGRTPKLMKGRRGPEGYLLQMRKGSSVASMLRKKYRTRQTQADMTGIPRTIMVEGKPFNTEHKLNEYNHIKPIKQNTRGLGPDRNMAACKETEELTKAGILRKVKHQTWVANLVMVKKSDGGWRMCGLHRHKQGLPQRLLPTTRDRLENRIPLRVPSEVFSRCLQGLPLNPNGRRRRRQNSLLCRRRSL
ncbi:hypothetical protein Tco_1125774, partial [Tanacetum coccineum]